MFIHDIYALGESDSFDIKAHEEATVNLELEKVAPGYHTLFTGNVLHRDLPIRNATVLVMDDNCNPLSSSITDEDGIFKFCNMLKPGIYKVIASAIGYNTSAIKTIQIDQNEVTKLSFSLKKSSIFVKGIVYGKILEAGSKTPIEAAGIYLKSSDADELIYKTISNHTGQYLIYNIMPDSYKLVIKKQGYMEAGLSELKIEKYSRTCLYFDLISDADHCKNTISGKVTFQENPIAKAAVFLYRIDQQESDRIVQIQETNENGIFLFLNVESGAYLVRGKQQNSIIYEKNFTIE